MADPTPDASNEAEEDAAGTDPSYPATYHGGSPSQYYGLQNGTYVNLDSTAHGGYTLNGAAYTGPQYSKSVTTPDTYNLFNANAPADTQAAAAAAAAAAATTTPAATTPAATTTPSTEGQLSTTPGVLPGTTMTAQEMEQVQAQNAQNVTNPTLSTAETATPVNQAVQANELLTNQTIDPNADQVGTAEASIPASTVANTAQAATPVTLQAAMAQNPSQLQAALAADPTGMNAATYQAALVNLQTLSQATQAVTASLPANALVSNQLQSLLTPDANGNLPAWVQPAVTAANQFLAGRGISNSTMAGQAITAAILTASIPIATSNASAELTAFQQNLSNQQAAALQNGQAVIQGYFNNQSATNAAANFNATSEDQTNQFMASLAAQTNQYNASQINTISQFNSAQASATSQFNAAAVNQTNQFNVSTAAGVSEFNAGQQNSVAQFNAAQTQTANTNSAQLLAQLDQFNSNMANQREQFNTQNAIIVQQSNVEYQRAVNTANTAVQNQDNQLNAQNAMGLSTQAMANLQQEFNDNATMLYNSNMTAEEQSYALTYLSQQYGLQNALDTNITEMQENEAQTQAIGTLVGSLFAPVGNALGGIIGSAVNSIFGGGSGTSVSGQAGVPNSSGVDGADGLGSDGVAPTGGLDDPGSLFEGDPGTVDDSDFSDFDFGD